MNFLKDREKRILEYMVNEIKSKGYPPTIREMCNSLGIKSTSTAHKDLSRLEKKGYIRKDPSKPRAIEILNFTSAQSIATENDDIVREKEIDGIVKNNVIEIPVIGNIAAGSPILADQNIEDSFPVPSHFISNGNYFMLNVKGDSMIEAGIFDGDYILIKQQDTANNGDIVAAMLDGLEHEATVKTFYKESNHIRLQPENHNMEPIIVTNLKILGLVKGVFRFFN